MSFRGINDFLSSGMKILRHHPSECGICLDKFAESNPPSNPHSPVQIHCGHVFGRSCLVNWANNTTHANHNKCPICLDRLFDKDRSGNPSNNSSRTNDPSRTSYHTTRREDTNPQREASRNERQVTSRYPPAPTTVTPTPSEDSLYGHTLRRVTARIPSRRPATTANTTPSESRDLSRVESRSNVVARGSYRDQPRLDSRSSAVPQGTYRIVPQGSYRDQPRFESRTTAIPQGTPRTMAPVTPRSTLCVSMLNPVWPGNQLPTRTTSAAPSRPSTGQTDTPSVRCEVYVDARQYSNHYACQPQAEDDGTDSGTSSGSDSTWTLPRSSRRRR
ncbi:hypothetical protein GRF29_69g1032630 [Pseudopithomyces chartarum]|uniref:RING-type domain-containing protein n=1 Tax=Pseudopithomyces chartarum TaxID=1892770 RepID=A0AAN6RGF4_9PLEO|nr:hypothetical protein GRF29_69g1032630 [Pseudopithomyces chartarum]